MLEDNVGPLLIQIKELQKNEQTLKKVFEELQEKHTDLYSRIQYIEDNVACY